MKVVEAVRNKQPLIHHLTNEVVINFTANGLLAFGGSPIMAKEPKEAYEIASLADGVLINIGTAVERDIEAMLLAGKAANEKGIPVVFDPVGIAATPFRQQAAQKLLNNIAFTAIKGNAGEMAYLVDIPWKTKVVESLDDDLSKLECIAFGVAKKYDTIAVVTGKVDIIAENKQIITNNTGHEYLTKITGAGCLLGSIITACLTTELPKFISAYEAVQFYGHASETAADQRQVKGTGTFLPTFIDVLGI